MADEMSADELMALGRRHLAEERLRQLGAAFEATRVSHRSASEALQEEIKGLDGFTEMELHKLTGVNRTTIRVWLGKQDANRKPKADRSPDTHATGT